jgi:hypothetical protein
MAWPRPARRSRAADPSTRCGAVAASAPAPPRRLSCAGTPVASAFMAVGASGSPADSREGHLNAEASAGCLRGRSERRSNANAGRSQAVVSRLRRAARSLCHAMLDCRRMGALVSVNVGRRRQIAISRRGRPVISAGGKSGVAGRVAVRGVNLAAMNKPTGVFMAARTKRSMPTRARTRRGGRPCSAPNWGPARLART